MTQSANANDIVYTWNAPAGPQWAGVEIEDDSFRDGLQGAFVRRPSLEETEELLALTVSVGTQNAMLGFPAISDDEFERCRALVRLIEARGWSIVPRFLARAKVEDVEPIVRLHEESDIVVETDYFMGTSPLRRHVEGWDLKGILQKVDEVGNYLSRRNAPFGISVEDASRTPPNDLRDILKAALSTGAQVLTICDTVGESTPAGVTRLLEFVGECAEKHGAPVRIWWHGHNDRGLAFANAVAAVEAGAHAVSGAFLGLGERTGNTALEQIVMFAHQHGNAHFEIGKVVDYCAKLAEYTATPVPDNAPLVGDQAFATCTGTHSAAILKARHLGIDFEDFVFSSIPASKLGRAQNILIGPTSGLANARHVLSTLNLDATEENARHLVRYAKTKDRFLRVDEIRHLMEGAA